MMLSELHAQISKLYQRFSRAIFCKIRSIIQNDENAADVLQVVFERLYMKARRELGSISFCSLLLEEAEAHAYLYRIAVNESYRFLQKNKQISSLDEDAVRLLQQHSDVVQSHIASQQLQHILRYLEEKAGEREQTLFYLSFYEGKSQKEIAEILDVTTRYVRSLQVRLVQDLKRHISSQEK